MSINFSLIGLRIKTFRLRKQMTQAELAEKIDMSVTYVSHIERNKKHASLKSLILISDALEITVDVLLSGNQRNAPSEHIIDIVQLLDECTYCEKRFFLELAVAVKKFIMANKYQHDKF